MKLRYLFFITLLWLSKPLSAQIIDVELLSEESLSDINSLLTGLGIPAGVVEVKYGINMYRVRYFTTHPANGQLVEASGALMIPRNYTCPLPIVSYQHGTVTIKTDVPSFNNGEGEIGKIFASTGYVVTLPDYIGLGTSLGLHPYVHAKSQADAAIDLIRAARSLTDSLDFKINDQLFLFGYSQGGHATMALHKEIEENHADEFTVTGSCPMSGPYDLSDTQAQIMLVDSPYSAPAYLPYVILAYQSVYGNLYENPSDIFVPPYDVTIPPLFNGMTTIDAINSQLPSVPSQILHPHVIDDYINNPESPLKLALQDNDVYDWKPEVPMRILYCDGDDQVDYRNSVKAHNTFVANGADQVEIFNFGNFSHGGCVPFCLLSAITFFAALSDVSNGMMIEQNVTPASSSNSSNGQIELIVSGGMPPYSYYWFNQTTQSQIGSLLPGVYAVTVYDAIGCEVELLITVGTILSAKPAKEKTLNIFPNPSGNIVQVEIPESGEISILSPDMQLLYKGDQQRAETFSFDVTSLAAGVYIVEFKGRSGAKYFARLLRQ